MEETIRNLDKMEKLHDELTTYQKNIKRACEKLITAAEDSRGGMNDANSKSAITKVIGFAEDLKKGLPTTYTLQDSLKRQIEIVRKILDLRF